MNDVEIVARAMAAENGEQWQSWQLLAQSALAAINLPARDAANVRKGMQRAAEIARKMMDGDKSLYGDACAEVAAAITAAMDEVGS